MPAISPPIYVKPAEAEGGIIEIEKGKKVEKSGEGESNEKEKKI